MSESLLTLPLGLPLKFLHLEQQLMSYRSVHGRGTDLEIPFLCFRVTLDIASRSPFGIFVIGGAAGELQVRARSDRCARARRDVLEGSLFSISSASNFNGGLPKESLRLDQPLKNNLIKNGFPCMA